MRDKNYAIVFYHYDRNNIFRYCVMSCEYVFIRQLYFAYYKYMTIGVDRMISIIDASELKYLEEMELAYNDPNYYANEIQIAIEECSISKVTKELNKRKERLCKI